MGRMYAVVMDAQAITAAGDLVHVVASSTQALRVHRVLVTQDASETSEQLPFQIHRTASAGSPSPVGTSTTPAPLDPGDAACSATVLTDLTLDTEPTTIVHRESVNVLTGLDYHPTPEERITIPAAGELAVRLDASPAASLTFTLTAIIEEIG